MGEHNTPEPGGVAAVARTQRPFVQPVPVGQVESHAGAAVVTQLACALVATKEEMVEAEAAEKVVSVALMEAFMMPSVTCSADRVCPSSWARMNGSDSSTHP